MKQTLIIACTLALISAGPLHAQTNDLPEAGSIPGSPLYFVERISESIGTFFRFGNSAKAERYLKLSEERLAEAKELAEEGSEKAQTAVERYEEQVARAQKRAIQTDDVDLESRVADATTKHLSVLDRVLEQVPDEAKDAIERAQERSVQGQIKALRGIAEENPERAVDIFSRASEGRLRAAEARAGEALDDDEDGVGRADRVDSALNAFNEYAEFGKEISGLAQGMQSGTTSVTELVEKATSHHLDILNEVRSRVPEQAQERIQEAIERSSRVGEIIKVNTPPGEVGRNTRQQSGQDEASVGNATSAQVTPGTSSNAENDRSGSGVATATRQSGASAAGAQTVGRN